MKKISFSSIASWLLHFVELQLFLTTLSLPVLIAWGLPVSSLAIVGNLIFSPFLAAFLLISSLLFIAEILAIPNQPLIWLLDQITRLWVYLLNSAHQGWLVSYPEPPHLLLIVLGLIPLMIIGWRSQISQKMRIGAFSLLLIGTYGLLHVGYARHTRPFSIDSSGSTPLPALLCGRQLVVIETGAFARLRSADAWIDYTLMPTIIRHTGSSTIHHLVACNISARTLEGLCSLIGKTCIENIYVPVWQGTLSPAGWRHYYRLRELAKQHNCTIIRIGDREKLIKLAKTASVSIKPTGAQAKKKDITVPRLIISHTIDNTSGTLYDAS